MKKKESDANGYHKLFNKFLYVTPKDLPEIIDDTNKLKEKEQLHSFDEYLRMNLAAVPEEYDKGRLELLTKKGINLPSQDSIAISILVWGLDANKVDVLAYLIFLGCEINLLSGIGFWPTLNKSSVEIELAKLFKKSEELFSQLNIFPKKEVSNVVINYLYDGTLNEMDTGTTKHIIGNIGAIETAEYVFQEE